MDEAGGRRARVLGSLKKRPHVAEMHGFWHQNVCIQLLILLLHS